MKRSNHYFIFNWVFITGLLVLALNDHYLKQHYHNWLTGKLSDFAGLLIFPMFLQFVFPRLSGWSVILTGLLFIFWKLPISSGFIHFYNTFTLIPISRTLDYSDYIALAVLPLTWYLMRHIHRYGVKTELPVLLRYAALIPVALIFMATGPSVKQSMLPGGDVHIGKYYQLKVSEEQALARLRAKGYHIATDTSKPGYLRGAEGYIIKDLVLDGGKDTVEWLQFAFLSTRNKPLLLINNIKLRPGDKNKDLRILKKCYRQLIKADIVEGVE